MSRLDIQSSPPVEHPLRFFNAAIVWGLAAGPVMAWLDPALWLTRWHPDLLALVHLVVLGVIGQVCMGALLQFLAAAAASPVPGSRCAWAVLHAIWNAGVVALVWGFLALHSVALQLGGVLLTLCLCAASGAMLFGLARSRGPVWLRIGLAIPLLAWPMVAALGVVLVAAMLGWAALDLVRWTDIHAIAGVGLVFVGLLVSVALLVMPMLMGTGRTGQWMHWFWIVPAIATLSILLLRWCNEDGDVAMRLSGGVLAMLAAIALLVLARRPHRRNAPLVAAWRLGIGLGGSAGLIWCVKGVSAGLTPAAMLLGGSLPLLILSMMLEIRAFLAWIEMQRSCVHGQQLPSVHVLLPDRLKWQWFLMQTIAAAGLACLAARPSQALAAVVAGCWCLAFVLLANAMGQPTRVFNDFQRRRGIA